MVRSLMHLLFVLHVLTRDVTMVCIRSMWYSHHNEKKIAVNQLILVVKTT